MLNYKIQRNKLTYTLAIIFLILYVLLISFSFKSSNQDASESSNLSQEVTEEVIDIIQTVDKDFNPEFDKMHSIVRKTVGHFGVFVFTGIFGLLTYLYFGLKIKYTLLTSLSVGLIVSVLAELIQLFSDGRACSVVDMGIDFSGYIVGSILVFTGFIIYYKKRINLINKNANK